MTFRAKPHSDQAALTFGSLFAGVDGLGLGLERAGLRCKWQVEIDPWCRSVLEHNFPGVPKFADVRDVGAKQLAQVDVIAGGFPCQDISSAGKRAGIEGERSGLWKEYLRIIRELRPRYVLVENVSALRHRRGGIYRVLSDLAESGYNARWDVLPAAAFGAPHLRERVFILAYPDSLDLDEHQLSDTLQRNLGKHQQLDCAITWNSIWIDRTDTATYLAAARSLVQGEPLVNRMDDGFSEALHQIKAHGNAVVPQATEFLGKCLIEVHSQYVH